MKTEILHTYALNENGKLVHINDAEKGNFYKCPNPTCNNDFILRKSGKTGKGSRRPHFAHKNISPNCTPESALHHTFKNLLVDLLEKYKSESKQLILNWKCDKCSTDYPKPNLTTNLLAKTDKIIEEYNLEVCRPDIALIDKEGDVIAAIEIVVTHAPEDNALDYYTKNGITLIQINLSSDDDLNKIQEKITHPDIVNLCFNTKCPNYKNHIAKKRLMIAEIKCEKGSHPMKVCRVEIDSVFGTITGLNLTNDDLETAQSNGVLFKKDTKNRHLTFICKTCEQIEKNIELVKKIRDSHRDLAKKQFEEQRRLAQKRMRSRRNKFRF